ncbi:MAG TPA: heme-binding domain-containing protein, partial [Gemmatimonadaceae bacterium]|nr:heme-binding domain-containing protein [Gemmatimonadaceae bacterium]
TETRWPIWAYIAPVSWQVVADVNRARQFLNFNDWAAYDATTQRVMRQNIERVTATHKMPLWYYLTLHPDARLNAHDTRVLHAWTRGDSTTLR